MFAGDGEGTDGARLLSPFSHPLLVVSSQNFIMLFARGARDLKAKPEGRAEHASWQSAL